MQTLISHYVLVEFFGQIVPVKQCSRKVGEVFTDSYGTEYEVQKDFSVRRISPKKRFSSNKE